MAVKLVTKPAELAVLLEQAKAHLNVTHTDDDDLIRALIEAATTYAEKFTGRAFIDQTLDYYADEFPDGELELPKPPLIEVIGVFYANGSEAEFTDFLVDYASEPANLYLSSSGSWPTPDIQRNAVRIRYRAGYIDANSPPLAAVPPPIKAAINLRVQVLYERGAMDADKEKGLLNTEDTLLRLYRVETAIA